MALAAKFRAGAMLRGVSAALIACACLALAVFVLERPASAQGVVGRSYVTPFPENDRYHAIVIGDGLAQGIAGGLTEAFSKDGAVSFADHSNYNSGLSRPEALDWAEEVERIAKSKPVHIVVVMIGANDARLTIRTGQGNARAKPGEPEWRQAYGRQVERLLRKLKSLNVAVYWVGMPVVSNPATNEAMDSLNDVFREKTYLSGVRFIDSWSGFADQSGGYSAFGPDLTGQNKRLRESDGVYFTALGNRKLAHYVEVALRRDLAAARSERNIPLAGDESEQDRLRPKDAAKETDKPEEETAGPVAPAAGGDEADAAVAPGGGARVMPAPGPYAAQAAGQGAGGPGGEMIWGDSGSGVTALASISPATDLSLRPGQGRTPASERLYGRVLLKGEYLPPKPGRADDYAWPPPEAASDAAGAGQAKPDAPSQAKPE